MKSKEIWKDIPNFEGKYQVSNLGNVRSMNYRNTGEIKLLSKYNCKNYLSVKLTLNGVGRRWLVHQLVMLTFVGENNGLEINHEDGNKHNNEINNLTYCTRSENVYHAYRTGLKKAKSGANHPKSRPVYQIKNNEIIRKYEFINDVEKYGFSHSKVILCCQNKRNFHKGYKWEYASEN